MASNGAAPIRHPNLQPTVKLSPTNAYFNGTIRATDRKTASLKASRTDPLARTTKLISNEPVKTDRITNFLALPKNLPLNLLPSVGPVIASQLVRARARKNSGRPV
jgi:hypothetical protein